MWQSKTLNDQYLIDKEGKEDTEKTWSWLRNDDKKKENEGF